MNKKSGDKSLARTSKSSEIFDKTASDIESENPLKVNGNKDHHDHTDTDSDIDQHSIKINNTKDKNPLKVIENKNNHNLDDTGNDSDIGPQKEKVNKNKDEGCHSKEIYFNNDHEKQAHNISDTVFELDSEHIINKDESHLKDDSDENNTDTDSDIGPQNHKINKNTDKNLSKDNKIDTNSDSEENQNNLETALENPLQINVRSSTPKKHVKRLCDNDKSILKNYLDEIKKLKLVSHN